MMSGAFPAANTMRFKKKLETGQFVITAEITPPVSCARDDLVRIARPLKRLADAVNITDGAGARAHMAAVPAASILIDEGIEPVLQLVCRDRNRIALQSDLMAAAMFDIRNILVLRGDDLSKSDQAEAKPVFDLDPVGLLQTARGLRDRKELPNGRKVAGSANFFLGAADLPIDPPADWKPGALIAKIAAGARFVQTQFCMDADILRNYMGRLVQSGITEQLFFLIGIAPLKSARSARWMRERLYGTIIPEHLIERMERSANPELEGHHIALELIQEYSTIAGVSGVHIMAPNNERAIPELISAAWCVVPTSR